jgi:FixJ family two-component response regulator
MKCDSSDITRQRKMASSVQPEAKSTAVSGCMNRAIPVVTVSRMVAATPAQAIVVAEQHDGPIHLLITDVVMPAMNGKELRDRLCARRPALRWLFMSGYTADVIAPHGVLDEGLHFLQKPFSLHMLRQKVREVLAQPS